MRQINLRQLAKREYIQGSSPVVFLEREGRRLTRTLSLLTEFCHHFARRLREPGMANPEIGYFTAYPVIELKDLTDNSEVLTTYDGQTVNVRYDRVLRATQNADGNHQYYDLQGRKLPGRPATSGVYIHNGKKIINKKLTNNNG